MSGRGTRRWMVCARGGKEGGHRAREGTAWGNGKWAGMRERGGRGDEWMRRFGVWAWVGAGLRRDRPSPLAALFLTLCQDDPGAEDQP